MQGAHPVEIFGVETQKIYVNPDDTALLECPHCHTARTRSVAKFRDRKGPVEMKCRCGSTYRVSFEFRRTYRKEVALQGYYRKHPSAEEWSDMEVTTISLTGLGFLARFEHKLKRGDELKVRVILDDTRWTEIEKDVVVKFVDGENIGSEFTGPGEDDSALGFYLMR